MPKTFRATLVRPRGWGAPYETRMERDRPLHASPVDYRGVYERREKGKSIAYRACISVKDRTIHLGTFAGAEEAAVAYDDAAVQYHGAKAILNFPARYGNAFRRRWSHDDDERLTGLLGRMPPAAIAHRLGRSESAVTVRMARLGLAQRTANYTAHAAAAELGVSVPAVCYLIRTEQVRPLSYRSRWHGYLCWHIPHEEIERFIAERVGNPRPKQKWDWRGMPDGYFRNYAREIAEEATT